VDTLRGAIYRISRDEGPPSIAVTMAPVKQSRDYGPDPIPAAKTSLKAGVACPPVRRHSVQAMALP
jgi:hypothetical protein